MALSQRQVSILSLAICAVLVSMIFVPAILFFCFMLLPTIFLSYYDTDPEKNHAKAVGSLNIIGTAHAVSHSLANYGSLTRLSELLGDPFNWIYPLGLSLLGYIIYRYLPLVIRTWEEFWLNRKEALLKERQIKLVEEWGNKVKGKLGVDETGSYFD